MKRTKRFEIELKIVEVLRKKFEIAGTNTIVLNMKNGRNLEVRKLPTYKLSYDRYEVVSLRYGYIKSKNETYYGEAEGLDGVAEIIMKISRL